MTAKRPQPSSFPAFHPRAMPIDYADEPRPDRLPPEKLREAMRNFDLPADRERLLARARELEADDVARAIEHLPRQEYRSLDEVVRTYDDVTSIHD